MERDRTQEVPVLRVYLERKIYVDELAEVIANSDSGVQCEFFCQLAEKTNKYSWHAQCYYINKEFDEQGEVVSPHSKSVVIQFLDLLLDMLRTDKASEKHGEA